MLLIYVLERFKASHAFTESDVMTYDHYETSNLEVLKQLLFWMLWWWDYYADNIPMLSLEEC